MNTGNGDPAREAAQRSAIRRVMILSAPRRPSPTPDDLTPVFLDELVAYVKLFKLGEQRCFDGLALASLVAASGEPLHVILQQAVDQIPDERYRDAAFHLLVDPKHRTCNLTTRSANAASVFGVAAETFRKKINGTSPRLEVLTEVSAQLALLCERSLRAQRKTTAVQTALGISRWLSAVLLGATLWASVTRFAWPC